MAASKFPYLLTNVSTYIEVAQGAIILEQKLSFWLVLGWMAVLIKKFGADYEQLLKAVFSSFHRHLFKYCSVHT